MFVKIFLSAVLVLSYLHNPLAIPVKNNVTCSLPAPSSLSANWSGNHIRASWSAVTNADGYHIRVVNKATDGIIIEDITGGQYNSYLSTGIDNSNNYRIIVRAMCGSEYSDNVIIIDVTGV